MRNPATGEFEGYCIDLLKRLADMMGFNYTLYEVEDRSFGTQVDGEWNGIVRDIMQEVSALTYKLILKSLASYTYNFDILFAVISNRPTISYLAIGSSMTMHMTQSYKP